MRGVADGVELNGVAYRVPDAPVAVVCVDGGDPEYFEAARAAGCIPTVSRFMSAGFSAVAHCGIPSFTCPNNISIATGAAPKVHGISGNFYLDRATGQAVVMTGPELMRARTVFDVLSKAGAGTVVVTAKDKLRTQLGKGLDVAAGNVCFSSQHADRCTGAENGIADALGLFHALPHHPKLIGVLEQLLGGPVWVHPRHIVHAIFPADLDYTTPPHQGLPPGARGARHLDRVGAVRRLRRAARRAGRWFHSLTIHQGVDNTSSDRIRLAGSFRYQRICEPADAGALNRGEAGEAELVIASCLLSDLRAWFHAWLPRPYRLSWTPMTS